MKTIDYKLSDLREAEYNPRKKLSKEKMGQLKKSLTDDKGFLQIRPIIVNTFEGREGIVVGGNQRFLAAKELGWETIPAVEINVNLKKEKIINIKDNKEYGEFEFSKLADMLTELDTGELDVELTGFSFKEIENIMTWNKNQDVDYSDLEKQNQKLVGKEEEYMSFIIQKKHKDKMLEILLAGQKRTPYEIGKGILRLCKLLW